MVYYAMHTNFDVKGMADAAAQRIGLQNAEVLDVTYDDGVTKEGCSRIGRLPHRMTLGECAQLVKKCYQGPKCQGIWGIGQSGQGCCNYAGFWWQLLTEIHCRRMLMS